MISPYRGSNGAARAALRENLDRITPMLESYLPESLRTLIAEARIMGDSVASPDRYLEACCQAIALAPEVARFLDQER